jgi:uncharacterized protein YbaR (Trm112 family)
MDRFSVRFLCCPQCSATLIDATDDRMDCSGCSLAYPVRDGVPVLVIGEATSRPTLTDAEFERLIDEAGRAPFDGWDLSWLDARQTRTADGSGDPTHQYDERGPQPGNRWPQRRLPFADDTFDLVLASRAAFAPREIARAHRSGATVLTLQGNPEWRGETLADAFGGTPPDWTLPGLGWDVGHSFRQAGLNVVQWTDYSAAVTYDDVGAVVFDFDLDRYRERLFRLHGRMQAEGGFRTRVCTNLIEAHTP